MKSELFEAEKSLLQDKELASKLGGSCATSEWEKSTETAVARRGTERTSATMATREQVQEALQQPHARGEGEKAAAAATASGTGAPDAGCTPRKREEGARSRRAVPSSFATAETNEQLEDNGKEGRQGMGPQNPWRHGFTSNNPELRRPSENSRMRRFRLW